ncbi:hypothetical protein [Cysteiniphilum marinum]|uniref:hypothetical protein n=1 Tax=Cysteiniphilum marinum TaxID=2774191 RepID=UPI00193A3C32|nr:hypothetical protein [Cysteiniphilum marinum]
MKIKPDSSIEYLLKNKNKIVLENPDHHIDDPDIGALEDVMQFYRVNVIKSHTPRYDKQWRTAKVPRKDNLLYHIKDMINTINGLDIDIDNLKLNDTQDITKKLKKHSPYNLKDYYNNNVENVVGASQQAKGNWQL